MILVNLLAELLESGSLMQWLGFAILVEVIVLVGYWHISRRGIPPIKLLVNIGAGGCLIGALWVSVVHHSPALIVGLLLLSFCFHLMDLALRWSS